MDLLRPKGYSVSMPRRAVRAFLAGCLLAHVSFWAITSAAAQARRSRARSPASREIASLLQDADTDRVRRGIEAVGLRGSAQAVQLLDARVRQGMPADLLLLAVHTAGAVGRPEAGPLLTDLLSHRRVAIRVAVVHALTDLQPPGVESALIRALSDGDPTVRAAAAEALGHIGSEHAIEPLFLAFDRGVEEAATSLGQLARSDDVSRILAYLGERSLETLSPALLELLSRRDIPTDTKVNVVVRLGEMATGEVRRFLEDFRSSLPDRAPSELREAAENAAARIAQ